MTLIRSSKAFSPSASRTRSWAYELGAAIALKKGVQDRCGSGHAASAKVCRRSAFPVPSLTSVRLVWATAIWARCCWTRRPSASAFLAGHESFAAAEGAIGIARNANKVRKKPLRVILNGLGKDAAMIISRINGFTYVQTKYDYLSTDVTEDMR